MRVSEEEKTIIKTRTQLREYLEGLVRAGFDQGDFSGIELDLESFDFDPLAHELVPGSAAEVHRVVPLLLFNNTLFLAIASDVSLYEGIRHLEFITRHHVEAIPANPKQVNISIDRLYTAEDLIGLSETINIEDLPRQETLEELKRKIDEKPLVAMVQRIIHEAIRKGASDIHIRPAEHHIDYLLRVDGNMIHCSKLDKRYLNAMISRFKILGGMDIAEHRLPQDGGARLTVQARRVEVRMSVMPTIHGESLVVRLLNTDTSLFKLEELGFSHRDLGILLKASCQSNGLVLVTGPTGSGKSTTLYALLQEIKKDSTLNIITVEDPVEFHVSDILQIQVNRKTNYSFARALRNILRHDPDVIMVGEIRDEETAKTAIECALTGHLVLTTLHSVNSVSTVTRLLEMGVKPYLLKATLTAIVAQRLAKLNCTHCLVEDGGRMASHLREEPTLAHVKWKRGKGCEHCSYTGLSGRKGVYEVLHIDTPVSRAIRDGVTEDEILQAAVEQEMMDLATSARLLAEQGVICAEEYVRLRIS
jgi:type IV pilus assembly protein PilB